MARPPTPCALCWQGQVACFVLLPSAFVLPVIAAKWNVQFHWTCYSAGWFLSICALFIICGKQGLLDKLITEVSACYRAWTQRPRTDP